MAELVASADAEAEDHLGVSPVLFTEVTVSCTCGSVMVVTVSLLRQCHMSVTVSWL